MYSVFTTTICCSGEITQKKDIYTKFVLMLHIPVPEDIDLSVNLVLNKLFSNNQSHAIENKSLVTHLIVLS